MSIRKSLTRFWVVVSLISVAVDAVCFWQSQHSVAPLPGSYTYNYIMIFFVSAPVPFVLAIVLTVLGFVLASLRWIWDGFRRAIASLALAHVTVDRAGSVYKR